MKKKILILTLIMVFLSTGFVWAAGNEEGEDAHSPSMSVESGEEPIEDPSTTKDPGTVDIDEESPQTEEPAEAEPAEEEEQAEEPAAEEEETMAEIPWKLAAIAGACVLVVIVLITTIVSRSRNKGKYKGKH